MLHVRDGRTFMVLFDRCSVQVFHAAALFALIHSCRGQSEVIGPLQPVVALIGDDIKLPCNLDPVMDAFGLAVEWARPDLDPRFVLLSRHGVDLESKKHPSYTSRTSLFTDELKNGNISLQISKVKLSDEGKYKCFVPELDRYTTVQLVVGAASSPAAWINSTISSSRVVLQCESAGWYPEPELLWLDGEGNLLSAGPTETLRGPDDLYTVSSRVTVEKRHSNNITCRVQQRNTNQSRETHIHVPDDFFMVISPPSKPASHPNIIIGVVTAALVVLILILTVVFVVWRKRRAKHKKKKSEEDGAEIGLKGESEPLMNGKEDDDDVDRREAQRREDKRETKQDQLILETEQIKDINSPQENRINPSTVIGKESLLTIEQKTHESQEVTGRKEEHDVDNSGEKNCKDKIQTQQDDHEKETEQRRNTKSPEEERMSSSVITKKEPELEMKEKTHEEQSRRGREEEQNMNMRGEQKNKDDIKLRSTDDGRINQDVMAEKVSQSTTEQQTNEVPGREEEGDVDNSGEKKRKKKQKKIIKKKNKKKQSKELDANSSGIKTSAVAETEPQFEMKQETHEEYLSSDQEPWREKETQQEQFVGKTQMERNVDMKKLDTEKKRAEENSEEGNNLYSVFMGQKETQREKLEAEQQREENQRDKMGMTERKREEERGQTESMISSVISKVPLNTDLKIQDKTRGQNHEKQPEETSQQSREGIREQPKKLRGAERKEGAQGEELEVNEGLKSEEANRKEKEREKLQLPHEGELQVEKQVNVNEKEQLEESVSLTERGVVCVEEKQEEELMETDQPCDVDRHNIQSRKHTQEIKLQEVCTLPDKKEEIQSGHHQNFKKVQKYVNKQNYEFMEVDDFAHNQNAATAQLNKNIEWANHQQRLPVQTEPQEFLKENDEDLEDQMEVEEHSHPKELKEEPMLLLEEKSSNFPLPLYTDQEPWRKKETQGQLVEKTQRVESGELGVNQWVQADEANRKDKEREKLQLPHEGELQAEQQVNVNQRELLEESVSLTERGVDCVEEKQEEETNPTCDADQKNDRSRNRSNEQKLQEVCTVPSKKAKVHK